MPPGAPATVATRPGRRRLLSLLLGHCGSGADLVISQGESGFTLRQQIAWSLLLAVIAVIVLQTGILQRWDLLLYDWNRAAWSRAPGGDILIVAIDEQSLHALGRWPWSRRYHAQLIRELSAAGARVIVLDIAFAEPDRDDPPADVDLAAALAASGRVVLPVLHQQHRLEDQRLETPPIPRLAESSAALGHVDVPLDLDGIARSVALKAGFGERHWPTLALAALEVGDPDSAPPLVVPRADRPQAPSALVWQHDDRVLIPFAGPPGTFPSLSARDVLRQDFPAAAVRDRFVLVGVTASGMGGELSTPVSGLSRPMSAVEFHANVLDALRHGQMIRPLPPAGTLLLTALLAFVSIFVYAACPARWTLPLAGLALLTTLTGSFLLLLLAGRWFPPAATLLAQAISYPLWSWQRLRRALYSLAEQKERAQVTLQSIGDAVITTDAQGEVEYLNPVAADLLACTLEELRGQPLGPLFHVVESSQRSAAIDLVAWCLQARALVRLPEPCVLHNLCAQEYAVRGSAAPIHDQQQRIVGVVVTFSDISENRRLGEQMVYQATHDALTRLPNVVLLRDRLRHAIARVRRTGHSLALLFVDLDHFKRVNEGLGHSAGDALLQAVADRLRGCARKDDTIVRVGGDEFICMLEDVRQEARVLDFARKLIAVLAAPFQIGEHECFLSASIGICLFPKDGDDVETLLKNGDSAMYRAKASGRNTIEFCTEDMNARSLERLTLEQGLRHAIERAELELHYQPQMSLHDGRIVGVEALLRWRRCSANPISPQEFIPLAEETGLIDSIGEWVLASACRQAAAWRRSGLPALRMAVNFSPRQFQRPGVSAMVARVLDESGLDPCCLDMEITESSLMNDVPASIATMHELRAIGVTLSIDDFGMGYSSLNYLKQFPIGQLKIDKSFLDEVPLGQDDVAITLAIIAMAHSMSLKVIAEGVETAAQEAFLRANRCDEIQGYHLSRPLPATQMGAFLAVRAAFAFDSASHSELPTSTAVQV